MSEFFMEMPELPVEYSASFLVYEYFDRFLRDRKAEIFSYVKEKKSDHFPASEFKTIIGNFVEDDENYKTWLGEFGKILEAETDEDWQKCHEMFVNNLVNECMTRWYQYLK